MIASSTYELVLKCPECVNLQILQVSILGPALFDVYINDLPGIPDYCSLESYVDDSKLHLTFPVKAIDTPTRQITEDLKKDFSRGAVKIAF